MIYIVLYWDKEVSEGCLIKRKVSTHLFPWFCLLVAGVIFELFCWCLLLMELLLTWNTLCRPGWSQIQKELPDSPLCPTCFSMLCPQQLNMCAEWSVSSDYFWKNALPRAILKMCPTWVSTFNTASHVTWHHITWPWGLQERCWSPAGSGLCQWRCRQGKGLTLELCSWQYASIYVLFWVRVSVGKTYNLASKGCCL